MHRRISQAGSTSQLSCGHLVVPASKTSTGETEFDCGECDRRSIPSVTTLGRRTPTFTAETVPPALLRTHRTNAWAELVVIAGSVGFTDHALQWNAQVASGERIVIVPQCDHQIAPSSDAEFYVQFYDLDVQDQR